MKNKKLLAFALSMAVAAGCTACGGGQASTDTSAAGSSDSTQAESSATGDNTVIVAMGSGFSTLDPGYVYEKYTQLIVNACYENLFKFYENNGTPQPCLADTYEFSEDGLTLTVKLKDGLTFASGNKITSADVAFSINRTKNLKGNPSFYNYAYISDLGNRYYFIRDWTVSEGHLWTAHMEVDVLASWKASI